MKKESLAKRRHTEKMLKYWGDPENDFITRYEMHIKVLKIAGNTFYSHFRPEEVAGIEAEAMELRKKTCTRQRHDVYKALYEEAKIGNVQAIKEFLDRIEGKVIDKKEIKVDGKDLVPIINVTTTGN
jgi:hypothetical protein